MNPNIIIIGSDSFLGRTIKKKFTKLGYNVIGTTKRKERVNSSIFFLDINKDINIPLKKSIKIAIICTAITNIDFCENNAEISYLVNVTNTKKLMNELINNDIFIIYFSTNLVFNGLIPCYNETDKLSPVTQYGLQKAEIETFLLNNYENTLILRPTKVIGATFELFDQWKKTLQKGEKIYPFYDYKMSPIPVNYVVSVLRLLIEEKVTGLFNLSANCDITYSDAAYMLLKSAKEKIQLIVPVEGKNFFKYKIPQNTTLNCEKLVSKFGIQAPDVEWTIGHYSFL